LLEYWLFSDCFSAYDQLVDFWYEKTGVMIREKISSDVKEELWAFIKEHSTKRRVLDPEERRIMEAVIQKWEHDGHEE
jgi:CBS domain containing-hemolysin-like protein